MGNAALVLAGDAQLLVPEERALAMIEGCARQIAQAATIPDVMRAVTHAEAIDAVVRKIDASKETKRAALALLLDAEVQLGTLTKQIPKGVRGAGAVRGQVTKEQALKQHGLRPTRTSIAERLADLPKDVVVGAMTRSTTGTLSSVVTDLGLRQPSKPRSATQKIARDAIGLLVTCQFQSRPPKAEEVDPLREAFSRAADT